MAELFTRHARADGDYDLVVDLEAQTVRDESGFHARFSIEPYRRDRLLRGLDEIDRTLLEDARIAAYERGRAVEVGGSARREEA
jgi:3-isopropylmalate/(R)-2-methylmalate dehydratase small subunit